MSKLEIHFNGEIAVISEDSDLEVLAATYDYLFSEWKKLAKKEEKEQKAK